MGVTGQRRQSPSPRRRSEGWAADKDSQPRETRNRRARTPPGQTRPSPGALAFTCSRALHTHGHGTRVPSPLSRTHTLSPSLSLLVFFLPRLSRAHTHTHTYAHLSLPVTPTQPAHACPCHSIHHPTYSPPCSLLTLVHSTCLRLAPTISEPLWRTPASATCSHAANVE